MSTYFKHGSWNVHCDVCGFKFKADEVQKRWDGLIVCSKDYEQDHPQKYLRVHEDRQDVPFVRKQSDDTFIVQACDIWTSSPIADFGVADCAYIGGNTSIPFLIDLYYPSTKAIAEYAITGFSVSGVT